MKKIIKLLSVFILFIGLFPLNLIEIKGASLAKPKQETANVVIFAYFKDDQTNYFDSQENIKTIIDYYDGSSQRSFKNYMNNISYGQFEVKNIFPQLSGNIITPYEIKNTSKESATNANVDSSIIAEIIKNIPEINNATVDYDNDGFVDNLTIILNGGTTRDQNALPSLYPHKADYPASADPWGNKKIGKYNMLNTERMKTDQSSLIIHEYLHSLDFPDLYTKTGVEKPVGSWGIMAQISKYLQYPLAILRAQFGNWISIDEITKSTKSITLDLQSNPNGNQAVILKSPYNNYEYFVVEFRKKGDFTDPNSYDAAIPGSGLIVYRVNTTVSGLSNFFGNEAIYIFRPNGENNKINEAFLSQESGRTEIGKTDLSATISDGALTFSDGSNSGIVIKNVSSSSGNQMTFDVEIPEIDPYALWEDTNYNISNGNDVAMVDVDGRQVVASLDNNTKIISTSSYDGTSWKTIVNNYKINSNYVMNMQLEKENNEIYMSYLYEEQNTYLMNLKIMKLSNNQWVDVGEIKGVNQYSFKKKNNQVYIAYTDTNNYSKLAILESNGSISFDKVYNQSLTGTPKVIFLNDRIFVATRESSGKLYFYELINNNFNKIVDGQEAKSYGLATNGKKIYVVTRTANNSVVMSIYDGNNWNVKNPNNINSFEPQIAFAQGNIYVLTSEATANNPALSVYEYKEDTDTYVKEGTNAGMNASDYSLTASDKNLYVSYIENYSNVKVKKKVTANELLSLTITPPNKLSYFVGETVDTTGLKVVANYRNEKRVLTSDEYTISDFDTKTSGTRMATVSFAGISNTFVYNVSEKLPTLVNLDVTLNKTNYNVGDKLTDSDISIEAVYDNGNKEKLSLNDVEIKNFNTENPITNGQAIVSYQGIEKSFMYNVISATGLSVTLHKSTFLINEQLTQNDITIKLIMSDNNEKEISLSNVKVNSFNTSKEGTDFIATITYENYRASFTYNVDDPKTEVLEGKNNQTNRDDILINANESIIKNDDGSINITNGAVITFLNNDQNNNEIRIDGNCKIDQSGVITLENGNKIDLLDDGKLSTLNDESKNNIVIIPNGNSVITNEGIQVENDASVVVNNGNGKDWNIKANTIIKEDGSIILPGTNSEISFKPTIKLNSDGSISVPGKDGIFNESNDELTISGDDISFNNLTGDISILNGGVVTYKNGKQEKVEPGTIIRPDGIIIKPERKSYSYAISTGNNWETNVNNGTIAGNEEDNASGIKGLIINASEDVFKYSANFSGIGWKTVNTNEKLEVNNANLEAIKIELKPTYASQYDISYRVKTKGFGWLEYAVNGKEAGSEGYGDYIQAIQIKIEPKQTKTVTTNKPAFINTQVRYKGQIQNIGWQDWLYNGQDLGTVGLGLRLESMKIELKNADIFKSSNIMYRGHVQNIGWQDYVSNGEMSGTEGRGFRIEASQIKLDGDITNYFDIYYRTQVENTGWLDWAKNDELTGSAKYARRIETIQIKLVPKGLSQEFEQNNPNKVEGVHQTFIEQNSIWYNTHNSFEGWKGQNKDGLTVGSAVNPIESIVVSLDYDNQYQGGLTYKVKATNGEWSNEVNEGQEVGFAGTGKTIESLSISLKEGTKLSQEFDIYYRALVDGEWLGYAKNGQVSGYEGKKITGIQVMLVPKIIQYEHDKAYKDINGNYMIINQEDIKKQQIKCCFFYIVKLKNAKIGKGAKMKKGINILMILLLFLGAIPSVLNVFANEIENNNPIINYKITKISKEKNNILFILGDDTSFNNTSNKRYNIKEIKDIDEDRIVQNLNYEVLNKKEYNFLITFKNNIQDKENSFLLNVENKFFNNDFLLKDVDNTVTINYNSNGGQGLINNQVVEKNTKVILSKEKLTKVGYQHIGWNTQSDGKGKKYNFGEEINITENMQLFALWVPITYTIKFDGNGANSGSVNSIEAEYDTLYDVPLNNFKKDNCIFLGWNIDKQAANRGEVQYIPNVDGFDEFLNLTTIDKNIVTLYAVWQENRIIVSYDGNNAVSGNMSSQVTDNNTPIILKENEFKKDGYHFIGWSTQPNGSVEYQPKESVTFSSSITLYAVWERNTITIKFDGNGNTNTNIVMEPQIINTNERTILNNNEYTKEGYDFVGWKTSNGTKIYQDNEIVTLPDTDITEDTTLYAQWHPKLLTVTFHANNGTGLTKQQKIVADHETSLDKNTFTKEGYIFAGWSTTEDGLVSYPDEEQVVLLNNLDLYAIWVEDNTDIRKFAYTVRNEGSWVDLN